MRPLVQPYIESLKPYVPGKPAADARRETGLSEVVKLASNENPLGPSPKARGGHAAGERRDAPVPRRTAAVS